MGNLNPNTNEAPYGMSVSYSLLQKFKMVIEKRGLRILFYREKVDKNSHDLSVESSSF